MITEKTCKGPCGKTLSIEEFHWKSKRKGTRQARCKTCMSEYGHKHYVENSQEYKDRANSRLKTLRQTNRFSVDCHLKSHTCQKCGESNFKVLTISITSNEINNLAPEVLSEKLAQSTILCRNCQASQD